MIRVAVVEDSQQDALLLCRYLGTVERELEIKSYHCAENFLEDMEQGFDIVFMDIELPGCNGMEAARLMREKDRKALLIFITNMAQYAVKGYEVDAMDFIVKPVSATDFAFKMKRALCALDTRRQYDFVIADKQNFRRISTADLCYVEVSGHKLIYHLPQEVIEVRGRLTDVENELKPHGFLRCNNCFLVNARYVRAVNGYTVTVGGDELQISHPRRKEFLQELSRLLSKGGV